MRRRPLHTWAWVGCSFIILAALAGSGCASKTIVGTWQTSVRQLFNSWQSDITLTYSFFNDGTFQQLEVVKSPVFEFRTLMEGTYTLNDSTLTIVGKSVDVTGGTRGVSEQMKKQAQSRLNVPATASVKWSGSDQLTLTMEGKSFTFRRVSS